MTEQAWENPFQTRSEQARIINGWLAELDQEILDAELSGSDVHSLLSEQALLISIRDDSHGQFHLYKEREEIGLTKWVIATN